VPNPYEVPGGPETNVSSEQDLFCFLAVGNARVRSCVRTEFPAAGADVTGLHHTRMEALPPAIGRLQSARSTPAAA
jgi:hypothetical protein